MSSKPKPKPKPESIAAELFTEKLKEAIQLALTAATNDPGLRQSELRLLWPPGVAGLVVKGSDLKGKSALELAQLADSITSHVPDLKGSDAAVVIADGEATVGFFPSKRLSLGA